MRGFITSDRVLVAAADHPPLLDDQQGVPGRKDYGFPPNTWHSIELDVMHRVKERNDRPVRFALEA